MEITIDSDTDPEELELQIREAETHELLDLYRALDSINPHGWVRTELLFRYQQEQKLESEGQLEEIAETVGMR